LIKTRRNSDLHKSELEENEVRKYHSGYSDQKPSTSKTFEHSGDYPEDVYEGPVSRIGRHPDIEDHPMELYIDQIHHGRSDLEDEKVAEPKPSAIERLTSLLKREDQKKREDYPQHYVHEGPVESIPYNEVQSHPLEGKYHDGYYTSLPSTSTAQQVHQQSTDYPIHQEVHQYPIQQTRRQPEAHSIGLNEHVIVYHSGKSDEKPVEEPEAKPSAIDRLTSIFKKDEDPHKGYPVSSPYYGSIESTHRQYDFDHMPINELVTIYSTGKSDETPQPVMQTERHDYPQIEQVHEGEVLETTHQEAQHFPISEHSQVYHSGRSDEEPIKEKTSLFGSLFKKDHKDEYPETTKFEGQHDNMLKSQELDKHPIESYSSVYSSGKSFNL
jgi:hypothetical protein